MSEGRKVWMSKGRKVETSEGRDVETSKCRKVGMSAQLWRLLESGKCMLVRLRQQMGRIFPGNQGPKEPVLQELTNPRQLLSNRHIDDPFAADITGEDDLPGVGVHYFTDDGGVFAVLQAA